MCLVEGTHLSEGRGTSKPFEMIGAPWLDAEQLAEALEEQRLPGVRFRPASFQRRVTSTLESDVTVSRFT
jgi:beta-N-acetylhexosaminidase